MNQLLRVQNFNVSRDGFGAGDHQSIERPFGRNKFGPQRGPWHDHNWRGWWGDQPPFHTPVFVLTHHTRPSFTLGDTTSRRHDARGGLGGRTRIGIAPVGITRELLDRFHLEVVPSPSGVTHHLYWRR